MQIISPALRRTTQERHAPTRRYYIKPVGADKHFIERPMPKVDHVPVLWV